MKNLKKAFIVLLCAGAVYGMSSCNRGYGCPTDLKAATTVVKAITNVK